MVPVVIIPTLNRYDLLAKCINSIDYPVETLIVINNGKGKVESFDNPFIKSFYIWDMPSNLGVATSWNLGIKSTPFATGWLLLNDDAYFLPDKLQRFWLSASVDEIQLAGTPPWACAWVGSQVVKDVGLFCEAYHPAYFEDTDYERRAKHAKKHVWIVVEEVISHVNSATLQADEHFKGKNVTSFNCNNELNKMRNASFDEGHWDLQRRLDLSWD